MKKSLGNDNGMSYDEWFGQGKEKSTAVTANQFRGVPDTSGASFRKTATDTRCGKPTKAGGACKARPVSGHMVCVGHMKQEAVS